MSEFGYNQHKSFLTIKTMQWQASAPSNIALIKYMGKEGQGKNIALNPSLSYTLENLKTVVRLSLTNDDKDSWQPLIDENLIAPELSKQGELRFLNHFSYLKAEFGVKQNFIIQSANNFPMDAGLASSASSFAALTKAANLALKEISGQNIFSDDEALAKASQKGSGSSCRSFFSPWALWQEDKVSPINLPIKKLNTMVVIANSDKKSVSSSQAHQNVKTSPLFAKRVERAKSRLDDLINAFNNDDWQSAYQIVYGEFMDMHQLFETSIPGFSYFNKASFDILEISRQFWQDNQDGPLITMDAGANVHLLFKESQNDLAKKYINETIKGKYRVIF